MELPKRQMVNLNDCRFVPIALICRIMPQLSQPAGDQLPIARTPSRDDLDVPRDIVAVAEDHGAAGSTRAHSHPRGQLLYAELGTLTTTTKEGSWVAPPERALWIPAGIPHVTRHSVGTKLRTIFVAREAVSSLPEYCAVVQMERLLRELFLAVAGLPRLYEEDGADGRLVRVLLDRLIALPADTLHLPMPTDQKLRDVAEYFASNPGQKLTVDGAAGRVNMGSRTFARHFHKDTGLTWGVWQRQAKMLRALELLGLTQSVGDVAFELGYESTSAFVATFRKTFGTTPSRYFGK